MQEFSMHPVMLQEAFYSMTPLLLGCFHSLKGLLYSHEVGLIGGFFSALIH